MVKEHFADKVEIAANQSPSWICQGVLFIFFVKREGREVKVKCFYGVPVLFHRLPSQVQSTKWKTEVEIRICLYLNARNVMQGKLNIA